MQITYIYMYVYQDIRLNIYSIISTYTNLSLKTCLRACPCELFLLLGEPELHWPQSPPGTDPMSAHDKFPTPQFSLQAFSPSR